MKDVIFQKMNGIILSLFIVVNIAFSNSYAQDNSQGRMDWWKEAKFGMFIHWGLYSIPGGEWHGVDYGKEMGDASAEWIMHQADIPREKYAGLTRRFNPLKFDANEWVSLAKNAGMKYMVITAKHHDGFSMFDTDMTEYDVIDATPFNKDVVRELAEECRKQGLKFGVYYSHSRDWYHRKHVRKDPEPPSKEYQAFVKGQLRELLTNYGDMAVIWFDTGDKFTELNASYGRMVQKLQPECLISGRLRGGENMSDYIQLGDRSIPYRRIEKDFETPMTMRDNWGFDRDEDNWKSREDLLERFVLTVSRGGNMLLNVGPKSDGTLCSEEIERLNAIGQWMKTHGESIYGAKASPFDFDFKWGTITHKSGRLYLHVLNWMSDGISFSGLKTPVKRAYLLDDQRELLNFNQNTKKGSITVTLPSDAINPYITVIALELKGKLKIDESVEGKYHWNKGKGIKLHPDARK